MVLHQPCLCHQVMCSGQMISLHENDTIKVAAHVYNPNGLVFHDRARGTEQEDTAICRVVHHVVTDNCGTAADADTIGPLLVDIWPTQAIVVLLNDEALT